MWKHFPQTSFQKEFCGPKIQHAPPGLLRTHHGNPCSKQLVLCSNYCPSPAGESCWICFWEVSLVSKAVQLPARHLQSRARLLQDSTLSCWGLPKLWERAQPQTWPSPWLLSLVWPRAASGGRAEEGQTCCSHSWTIPAELVCFLPCHLPLYTEVVCAGHSVHIFLLLPPPSLCFGSQSNTAL